MARPNSWNEPMLATLLRDAQGRPQSALEGLFNPGADFGGARAFIFRNLENGALDALKLTSHRMHDYLSIRNNNGSVIQALLPDRCDEEDARGRRSCENGHNTQVRIAYCDREKYADIHRNNDFWNFIWDPPDPDHIGGFLVCATCKDKAFDDNLGWSRLNSYVDGVQNHPVPLPVNGILLDPFPFFGTLAEICDPCAQQQESLHPVAENFCTCKREQNRRWLCSMCTGDSLEEVYAKQNALRRRLKRVHRVDGVVRYDRAKPRRTRFCPACGVRKARRVIRGALQNTKICLLCRNFVVRGTTVFGPVGLPSTVQVATAARPLKRRRKGILGSAGPTPPAATSTRRSARLNGG